MSNTFAHEKWRRAIVCNFKKLKLIKDYDTLVFARDSEMTSTTVINIDYDNLKDVMIFHIRDTWLSVELQDCSEAIPLLNHFINKNRKIIEQKIKELSNE